ncbi:tetratricopeptide repeat protein [Paraflavitalea speifideaquila]|uniref:tetratricopeptide repeat protein n=1 Tax=Paraflavitalea speifideaquila TaxID=3076558 RepID=UPI0028E89153|nr:tetratricopeptide repeat protein [Paraflavitalea speifideiaquila]
MNYDMLEIRLTLSWSYAGSGNLESAINLAEEATEMAKAMNTHSYLKAAGYLAEWYEQAGDLEKALSYFEEISGMAVALLSSDANDIIAGVSLKACLGGAGRIYLKLGDIEKATYFCKHSTMSPAVI